MDKNIPSIAIVDDGINGDIYNIGMLKNDIEIYPDLRIAKRKKDYSSIISHGTICSTIIRKYAYDAQLSSIRILNSKNNKGGKHQLIKALYWCVENGIKIVNLSLGSIEFRDFYEIKKCVNDISEKLVIIAACNNRNIYTVPASLTNTIGVKCGENYINDQYQFNSNSLDGIEIMASSCHQIVNKHNEYCYTNISNSFAAPLITAKVHNILTKNPLLSLEQIKKELFKGAENFRNENCNTYISLNIDWINNYTIINPCSINENCNTNTIVIDNTNNIFDYILLKNVILKFATSNKNIILFSDKSMPKTIYDILATQEYSKIWNNEIYQNYLKLYLSEELIDINIPIILVHNHGTNDLLINLQSLFLKDGYYPIIISNKCIDILNGFEYLPTDIHVTKFMTHLYRKHNCDIIIFNIDDENFIENIKQNIECDIEINVSITIKKFSILNKTINNHMYKNICINKNNSINYVRKLYRKIIRVLN